MNRWNSLDQETVDVGSINSFKGRLDKIRKTRMGFMWILNGPQSPRPHGDGTPVRPHKVGCFYETLAVDAERVSSLPQGVHVVPGRICKLWLRAPSLSSLPAGPAVCDALLGGLLRGRAQSGDVPAVSRRV